MKTRTLVVIAILFFVVAYGGTYLLRKHGVESCRDRGGTPVTRSWLSEEAWDVSCIEVP